MDSGRGNSDLGDVNGEANPRKIRVGPKMNLTRETDITVEKRGDLVERIRVTCHCGEVTTIECIYPESD